MRKMISRRRALELGQQLTEPMAKSLIATDTRPDDSVSRINPNLTAGSTRTTFLAVFAQLATEGREWHPEYVERRFRRGVTANCHLVIAANILQEFGLPQELANQERNA